MAFSCDIVPSFLASDLSGQAKCKQPMQTGMQLAFNLWKTSDKFWLVLILTMEVAIPFQDWQLIYVL